MQTVVVRSSILLFLCLSTLLSGRFSAAGEAPATLESAFVSNWEFEPGTTAAMRRLEAPFGKFFDLRHAALTVKGTLVRGTRVSVRLRWAVQSRVGGLYHAATPTIATVSGSDAKVEFAPEKGQMLPVGHQRPWDALAAAEVTAIELRAEVFGEAKEKTLAVDLKDPRLEAPNSAEILKGRTPVITATVEPKPIDPNNVPPPTRVLDITVEPVPEGIAAAVMLTFRVEPLPDDPFPASIEPGSAGDVRVRLPDGTEALAFLDQDYFDLGDGGASRTAPLGLPYYKAYLPNWPAQGDVKLLAGKSEFKCSIAALSKNFSPEQIRKEKPKDGAAIVHAPPRWAPALEVPIWPVLDKADLGLWDGTPRGWRFDAGAWKPLTEGLAADAKAWRPVLFWNAGWGQFGGMLRPDFSMARRMDELLASADKPGPLLLIDSEPFSNQGMFNWFTNPLNAAQGGSLSGPGQLFRNTAGQDFSLRSARYAISRWGRHKSINSFLINLRLNAPGAEALHTRFAQAFSRWPGVNGKALVTTHPLAQEPVITAKIGGFTRGGTIENKDPVAAEEPVRVPRPVRPVNPKDPKPKNDDDDEKPYETPRAPKPPTAWYPGEPLPSKISKLMLNAQTVGTDVPVLPSEVASDPEIPVMELRGGDTLTSVCAIKPFMLPSVDWTQPAPDNFATSHALVFEVWLPADAPHDLRTGLHLRDRDNQWYQTLLPGLLRPGDWTTCICDLTGTNAQKLLPVEHEKLWSDYSRQRITEIGLHLFSVHADKPIVARIARIRCVKFEGVQAPKQEPIFYDTLANGQPDIPNPAPNKGDLWECHLQLGKTYENPFDPCQIDLAATITTPSGKTVRVNAFFDIQCKRSEGEKIDGKPGPEIVVPIGRERWTVRYRVQESGPHKVSFEIREGGEYKVIKSESVSDSRFSPEGQPFQPIIRNEDDWMYQYDQRNPAGKRKVERLKWVPGKVVATWNPAGEGKAAFTSDTKVASKYWHGFLRKSTDNRRLEFDDGSFYYALGLCVRSPADYRLPYDDPRFNIPEIDRLSKRGTYQYDEFFDKFHASGMNWARVWMCSWWGGLTWRRDWPGYQGFDRYNMLNAWRDDHVLNEAEKRGIYISLCLTNHGQYSRVIDTEWKHNPYTTAFGGPLASAAEFFSLAAPQKYHMNYLRYASARWGHSPAVLAFDLISEFEWLEEYRPYVRAIFSGQEDLPDTILMDWHESMAQFLKENDPNKHLVATHVSRPIHGTSVLKLPCIDLAASNAYSAYREIGNGKGGAPQALDEFYNGNNFGSGFFKGFQAFNKPTLVEEQGRHWMGVDIKRNGQKSVHNTRDGLEADLHGGLWGSMVQPLAGATGYWWALHVHFDDRYSEYKALAEYLKGEDLRAIKPETSLDPVFGAVDPAPTQEAGGLIARSLQSTRRAYVWVYHSQSAVRTKGIPPINGATLRLKHLEPGSYKVEFWDTRKGLKVNEQDLELAQDPTPSDPKEMGFAELEIKLPKIESDVALKVKKVK